MSTASFKKRTQRHLHSLKISTWFFRKEDPITSDPLKLSSKTALEGETITMNKQKGHPESPESRRNEDNIEEETAQDEMNGWRKYLKCVGKLVAAHDKNIDEWLQGMRGSLSFVAALISTMTFRFSLNPPGGVWPAKDSGDDIGCKSYHKEMMSCPGEAIFAVVFPHEYSQFLLWNTICFIASLTVCLLLVSGLLLNHRLPMWLPSIGMCIAFTSLALAYLNAVSMVTAHPVLGEIANVHGKMLYFWIGLLGLLGLFLTLRFVFWGVNKFINNPKNIREISANHL